MRTDPLLLNLLGTLTVYARQGRYHNLSILLGADSRGDPDVAWQAIERAICDESPWASQIASPDFAGFWDHLARVLIGTVQRYARALSRMWTLGPLGDLGRAHTPSQFLTIRDDELDRLRRKRTRQR